MPSGLEGDAQKQLEASSASLFAELKQAACKGLQSCQVHGEVRELFIDATIACARLELIP